MNIIFLDIDGVVATPMTGLAYPENGKMWTIDPTLMRAVANLARETESKIVITSTWRIYHKFLTFSRKFQKLSNSFQTISNLFLEGLVNVQYTNMATGNSGY